MRKGLIRRKTKQQQQQLEIIHLHTVKLFQVGLCNGYKARRANPHEWIRLSLSSSFVQFYATSTQNA